MEIDQNFVLQIVLVLLLLLEHQIDLLPILPDGVIDDLPHLLDVSDDLVDLVDVLLPLVDELLLIEGFLIGDFVGGEALSDGIAFPFIEIRLSLEGEAQVFQLLVLEVEFLLELFVGVLQLFELQLLVVGELQLVEGSDGGVQFLQRFEAFSQIVLDLDDVVVVGIPRLELLD